MSSGNVSRLMFRIAAAACIGCAPSALLAGASPNFTDASLAKSNAILGGPSALAQILAQQGSTSASVVSGSMRPASYALPAIRPSLSPARRAWTGQPDVFGSVAVKVAKTPLDQGWKRVAEARIKGSNARFARSLRSLAPDEKLQRVNSYVNQRVRFTDDGPRFGRDDVWTTASETLRRGKGDCEDYAIAKMQMLREAGISTDDLYLVLVKDLVRRSDHAVLVVRVGNRTLLLDNGTDRLVESETVGDYRPVFTFAASGSWTHGYRRSIVPAMAMASADIAALPGLPQR